MARPTNKAVTTGRPTPMLWWAGSLLWLSLSSLPATAQQSPAPSPRKGLSANLQQAEELRSQGLLDQAKALALKELQNNPGSLEAYNFIGFLYIDQKDYRNALQAFQQALKI